MARGRRPVVQRFDEYYRCYPMVMSAGPERPELNYGSKILLPPSALDKVSKLHVQWPIMLELINGAQQKHTHAGVLEFVAEEGRAYIPQWVQFSSLGDHRCPARANMDQMMQTLNLDVGDMIQIKTTSLELAKLVKLQPQSVKFLDVSDPRAVLENAFRNFAAVTKGDVFAFEYNGEIYEMAVLDVKPETPKMGVSMIETDVSVDFAPPVGYVEPSVQKPSSRAGSGTSTPRSVRGGGLPAGGLLHSQGTMAQAINYDAIAPGAVNAAAAAGHFFGEGNRLAPSKKGSKTATPANKPATPVPAETTAAATPRRRNGPMPLRLGPNRLFFGYEIKPVKTAADKEAELAAAKQPHFAGQGQTLRGGVKKEGDGDKDKGKAPDSKPVEVPKGRRLDGRAV